MDIDEIIEKAEIENAKNNTESATEKKQDMDGEDVEDIHDSKEITLGKVYEYLNEVANYNCSVCHSERFRISPSNLLMHFQSQDKEKKTPDVMSAMAVACAKCGNINIFDTYIIVQNIIEKETSKAEENGKYQ